MLSVCIGSRVGERMLTNDCSGVVVISTLLLLECEVRLGVKLKGEGGSAMRGMSELEDGWREVLFVLFPLTSGAGVSVVGGMGKNKTQLRMHYGVYLHVPYLTVEPPTGFD